MTSARESWQRSVRPELASFGSTSSRRQEAERAALIGRLALRADAEWLAELLIDLEEDEPARLHLVAALRQAL
jgi:hypothetical protein